MDPSERSGREQYRECMRNHAATLGTYATDGCGEYTPSSPTGATRLLCAACGCHRNFHRKYIPTTAAANAGDILPLSSPAASAEENNRSDGKRRSRTKFTPEQKERMMRFAEEIGWKIQRRSDGGGGGDGDEVSRFCREINVSRQVFKVWMHNHKNLSASSSSTTTTTTTTTKDNASPTTQ